MIWIQADHRRSLTFVTDSCIDAPVNCLKFHQNFHKAPLYDPNRRFKHDQENAMPMGTAAIETPK